MYNKNFDDKNDENLPYFEKRILVALESIRWNTSCMSIVLVVILLALIFLR